MRVLGINAAELIAGLIAIALGVFAAITATSYPFGTIQSMGPGFVPFWLGVILAAMGVGIIVVEGRKSDAEELDIPGLRPLLAISGSVLIFALTIDRFGLLPSVFLTSFVATISESKMNPGRSLIVSVALAAISLVVFQYGLGLQVRAVSW
jgi:hypothetical protein